MADAAFGILSKDSRKLTGNFFIDEDYLRDFENIQNFDHYSISPGAPLLLDFFLDDPNVFYFFYLFICYILFIYFIFYF